MHIYKKSALILSAILAAENFISVTVSGMYLDEFGKRDRFWIDQAKEKTLVIDGVEQYQNIENCLSVNLVKHNANNEHTEDYNDNEKEREIEKRLVDSKTGTVFLVEMRNAIKKEHAISVQILAMCIREHVPSLTESRALYKEFDFDQDDEDTLGGNTPTFLAPMISIFLPEIVQEMQRTLEIAYEAAGWVALTIKDELLHTEPRQAQPSPKDVGIRTSEHLTYKDFPSLGSHNDGASCYTVNFAFAGPDEYEGGEFFIIDSDEVTHIMKPEKYSCVIFLGGTYQHGVSTISGGFREMFSTEYWAYPDMPSGSTLWNADPDMMEDHIESCNKDGGTSCRADFPTKNATKEIGIIETQVLNKEKPAQQLTTKPSVDNLVPIYYDEEDNENEAEAFAIGLPQQLSEEFQTFIELEGIMKMAHEILYNNALSQGKTYAPENGTQWRASSSKRDDTDITWLDPGDERSYQNLISVLRRGKFSQTLKSMTKEFNLEDLVIQGVEFSFLSYFSDKINDNYHNDINVEIPGTADTSFKIILPIHIPYNSSAMLRLQSEYQENYEPNVVDDYVMDDDEYFGGELKVREALINMEYDVGTVIGTETQLAAMPCDYRKNRDFRISAGIYLAVPPKTTWKRTS